MPFGLHFSEQDREEGEAFANAWISLMKKWDKREAEEKEDREKITELVQKKIKRLIYEKTNNSIITSTSIFPKSR